MYTPDYDPRHANNSPFSFDDDLLGVTHFCFINWDPNFRADGDNPACVHYDIEWKLQLKKGRLSKLVEITEENLTLAPGAYWDKFLSVELAAIVKDKLPEPRYEPDETTVAVSVEKRSERNMRKQFDGLDVDWTTIEDKLRSWDPATSRDYPAALIICQSNQLWPRS
ncbi:hypothetical protein FOPG_19244 [Fusarium oxysporum f. sp. conglutinans race 2 54008]|uniref:Uncharacterized protein n=1 Tax=Fusarium oxysporum f. sp. conglutinans race 2 54008 TaxID=1089457 RepID=X0HTI8_FUSOX|nr:hypothetical protein FOPG_19244 [Fusarium oxysporum f. sp. conglutinans race 2 54008]